MPIEFQQILHLSLETQTGDQYIFKQVYGSELDPYLLPMYITLRLFPLEYHRQRLTTDHLHFISKSKKSYFILPTKTFSFIIKNRSIVDVVNKIVSSLGLKK
jgi:hypothetical protein